MILLPLLTKLAVAGPLDAPAEPKGRVTATVDLLGGVRGNAEGTVEQPDQRVLEPLEPAGTVAVLGDVRYRWAPGPWLGLATEAWVYFPEAESTLARLTPRAGVALRLGKVGHLDGGARYAVEVLPVSPQVNSGRAEGTLSVGVVLRAHQVDLVGTVVERDYFATPAWSFRTGEVRLAWLWQPSAWRAGLRASGQWNAGSTIGAGGALMPATGQQIRLGALAGWTGGRWDVSLDYRLYFAQEGEVEDAVRPQFTPIGEYDDDADALSAGGFAQHRVSLNLVGRIGDNWTVAGNALARLRRNEPGQVTSSLGRSLHAAVDVGRDLSFGLSVHGVGGISQFAGPAGGSVDPYGWLALRWSSPPAP